jgi:hypothetical protein
MSKYYCKICGEPLGYTHSLIDGDTIHPCDCINKSVDEKTISMIKKALKNHERKELVCK